MPFPKGYGGLFTRVRGRTFPKVLYPVRAQALSGSFTSPSEPTRTAKGNCPIVATGARRRSASRDNNSRRIREKGVLRGSSTNFQQQFTRGCA
jgi:hypothetical protein